jgi:assimilatory nitrate reductase catalytic subunit
MTVNTIVKTTCPYCGVGCGVLVTQQEGKATVSGDPEHPANFGKLCSKGSALAETLGTNDRLLYPMVSGQRASWQAAIDTIAAKFSDTIERYGPDAVAFYVSGQILTEDYYVANKLMKGFIGAANIDTNSRLCMASSVAGHKRAFGGDIVPGCYEDLELADVVILVGSNLAWCHPVIFQRLLAAREKRPNMKIIVLDPRETATTELADMHLKLKSGSDVDLFMGLFSYLVKEGCVDKHFVKTHTNDLDALEKVSHKWDLKRVSDASGITIDELKAFYKIFAETEKTVTVYSQGVNQAKDGTDKVNSIINCHLVTGRIGKPGMGPFSITGQPNAMGGREVGGLANQLASHMSLESNEDRNLVQEFWNSPAIAEKTGLKAVDLFDAVERGDIKAIWIMATNPVVSMPNADKVKAALKACDLVVVSDVTANTDTAECADILLPSLGWGEKDGMVTNSERRMSRQRSFLPKIGEARADWRQMCDVATAMGWQDAFDYKSPYEIFNEYMALSSYENDGARALDFSGMQAFDADGYDKATCLQWPVTAPLESDIIQTDYAGSTRLFGDGDFYTPNRRANFIIPTVDDVPESNRLKGSYASMQYPCLLNTGRVRDHWHTMTRTGKASILSNHISEPFVEISSVDASELGLKDTDLAEITSPYGQVVVRVLVTDRVTSGNVFAPIHWNEQFASNARIDALVAPVTDPVSGQPALKSSYVALKEYDVSWFGFLTLQAPDIHMIDVNSFADYWVKAPSDQSGIRIEMAGKHAANIEEFGAHIQSILRTCGDHGSGQIECLEYIDSASGDIRLGFFAGGCLIGLLYVSDQPVQVSRTWVLSQLGQPYDGARRLSVLAGCAGADTPDIGAIICSCMNVGENEINAAIAAGDQSVNAISSRTKAGTNCGSCRSDIVRMLRQKESA